MDAELLELISALSGVHELETISSCQGEPGGPNGYVHFYFGGWKKITTLAFQVLTPALKGIEASVSVEVFNESEPMGKLSFRAEELARVTSALKQALTCRKCSCFRGKGHREPRS